MHNQNVINDVDRCKKRSPLFLFISIVMMMMVIHTAATSQRKEVIGYYPSWKWKSMKHAMMPEHIPYEKLTMINYAFFFPRADGSIVGRDTIGDAMILKGTGRPHGTALVALAHSHGVKVLPSLGGWEDSHHFPAVAASERKRAAFAHACVKLIKEYDFDGIDIDWEFPGYKDHLGTPEDKYNFTKLLEITRDSLTALGKLSGRKFLLTAALPAGAEALKEYETDTIAQLLDMLNVMTYDFNGPWSARTGYNAPVFASSPSESERTIDAAKRLYVDRMNIPASKINLGVPFYGHTYTHALAVNSPHSGGDTVHFSPHGAFYYDILPLVSSTRRHWDKTAKVPYLIIPEWKTFISYDDEESIGYKADYILESGVRGVIIWEITGDYLPNGSTPLLDVIHGKFLKAAQQ